MSQTEDGLAQMTRIVRNYGNIRAVFISYCDAAGRPASADEVPQGLRLAIA